MVDDPGILAHLPNLPALHTEGGIAGAIFVLIVAFILKYFRSKKTKANQNVELEKAFSHLRSAFLNGRYVIYSVVAASLTSNAACLPVIHSGTSLVMKT